MESKPLETAPIEEIERLIGSYIKRGMKYVDFPAEQPQFTRDPDFKTVFSEFVRERSQNEIALIRNRLLSEKTTGTCCGAVMPSSFIEFKRILSECFNENGAPECEIDNRETE